MFKAGGKLPDHFYITSCRCTADRTLFNRYNILAPKAAAAAEDDKKASQVLLDSISLEAEKYRMGHTKACFSSVGSVF